MVVEEKRCLVAEEESLYQVRDLECSSGTCVNVRGIPALAVMVIWKILCCNGLLGCLEKGGASAEYDKL
jgi:hypothetical protein